MEGVELIVSVNVLAHDCNQINALRDIHPFGGIEENDGKQVVVNENLDGTTVSILIEYTLSECEGFSLFDSKVAEFLSGEKRNGNSEKQSDSG